MCKKGDKGPNVKNVQERLNQIIKPPAIPEPLNPDGIFGDKTEDAVKKFQGQRGLKTDGKIGPGTVMALHYETKGGVMGVGTHFIKKGVKSPLFKKIQEALNKKFGAGLVVDGNFGDKTEEALKQCYSKIPEKSAPAGQVCLRMACYLGGGGKAGYKLVEDLDPLW